MLKLNGKKERWDVWENIKVDYESVYTPLVLKTEDFEEERLLRFAEETEVEDLGVVGVLRNDEESFCGRMTKIENKNRLMRHFLWGYF